MKIKLFKFFLMFLILKFRHLKKASQIQYYALLFSSIYRSQRFDFDYAMVYIILIVSHVPA